MGLHTNVFAAERAVVGEKKKKKKKKEKKRKKLLVGLASLFPSTLVRNPDSVLATDISNWNSLKSIQQWYSGLILYLMG